MPVKHVQSAARVLTTFEALADHQPVGVGALARVLGEDKSAVQRALMTLAEAGWIRRAAGDTTRWEVSTKVLGLAHGAHRRTGLRERARPVLEQLRDDTGETAILNVPEAGQIVVLDVAESTQLVRTVPGIGLAVPPLESAAGQAILAHLSPARRREFGVAGGEARLRQVHERGWSVNDRDATPGASAVGAAVLDGAGQPVASITVSGPAERMSHDVLDRVGPLVARVADSLSGH